MKKSQISIFFIVGIIIIFFISLFIYFFYINSFNKLDYNSDLNLKDIIQNCIYESAKKQMEKTGLSEENKAIFIKLVKEESKKCTDNIFLEIEKTNYKIKEGEMQINLLLNNETLILDVNFELEISKNNQKFEIKNFLVTLDKSLYIKIPNGKVQKDTILKSADGKVELKIEKDTEIKDKNGNNVNAISLKIHDIKFNGLENKVVKSNLVYEGLPDGVIFSKPVKMSFKVDKNTLKEDISKYRVGKWNPNYGIWIGLPSNFENGYLTTYTNSFSYYAAPIEGNFLKITKTKPEQKIFEQKYTFNEDCIGGFQKANNLLIATENSGYNENKKENVIYGFNYYDRKINLNAFQDCSNLEIDDCKNFLYYGDQFENRDCPISQASNICNNKKIGEFCGDNKICILNTETNIETCKCEEYNNNNYNKLAYCDYRCVGGKIYSNDGIFKISLNNNGNDAISSDNFQNLLIKVQPIYVSEGDIALILPCSNGKNYKIEEGKIKICGLQVNNINKDSCASSGIQVIIQGANIDRYYEVV
ncbi:MAG: hypothetical protein QW757_03740 [Candidatus Woesearchaeota archaeon]